jgi:antirestriction protein ArdC
MPHKKYEGPSPEEKLAADLIALMEAGTEPWQRPWDGAAGEHRNLLSGHQYQGGNPLLLEVGNLSRGNTLPLWIGAGQAKQQGWHPAKGSKAARIMQPRPVTVEDSEGESRSFCTYKLVPVFNAADLAAEGEDAKKDLATRIDKALGIAESTAKPEQQRLEKAEQVLESWKVETLFGGTRACYSPALDKISMPEAKAFTSREHFCATWAHEQIHSTGHKSRLDRAMSGNFGTSSYAREELVAELGAAILCRRLEIGCQIEHHASYLSTWCDVLREEPRVVLRALGQAVKAADSIVSTGEASNAE